MQLPMSVIRKMLPSAPALPPLPPLSAALTVRMTWPVTPLKVQMMPSPLRLPLYWMTAKSSLPSPEMSPTGTVRLPNPPLVKGTGESMRWT